MEAIMRDDEKREDLIDLGAATEVTLGEIFDTKDESLVQPDSRR